MTTLADERLDETRLREVLSRALRFPSSRIEVITRQRLKRGVLRLELEVRGVPRSVIAKRLTPMTAACNRAVVERWLPAAGLSGLAPALLGVLAERDATWLVSEDLGTRSLERFEVFVDPGTHQLVASWGGGQPVTREISAVAAGEETIAFEEPLLEAEEEEEIADGVVPEQPRPSGSTGLHPGIFGALVGLGVLGGVYALYAIGWLIGGLRLQGRAQYLVFDVMYQGSL